MQNWKDLYVELSTKLTEGINGLVWADLWHNQVNFLDTEHPFPTPAVFFGFRSSTMQDLSDKVQQVTLQVDVYLFYETFSDTYQGSVNQDSAFEFLNILNSINTLLHGSVGENYSSMSRVSFAPVDTGNAGNLYLQTYTCTLIDYSAQPDWQEGSFSDVQIEPLNDNNYIIRT